jgi:hypothetical protein
MAAARLSRGPTSGRISKRRVNQIALLRIARLSGAADFCCKNFIAKLQIDMALSSTKGYVVDW